MSSFRIGTLLKPNGSQYLNIFRNAASNRQSRVMNKLIHGKSAAKCRGSFLNEARPKLATAVSITNPKGQGKNAPRRVAVLNMLFMQHISDLLINGELSQLVSGTGLEISNIKVATDFQCVNVYWVAKGGQNDIEISKNLHKNSGLIRHELSQLRLMGEVPRIQFVKDSRQSKLAEVDALLAKADFGEDYVTTINGLLPNDLITPGHGPVNALLHLPPMHHNVFGVDRDRIMEKICQNMQKTRQAWEKYETFERPNEVNSTNVDSAIKSVDSNTNEMFAKFLEQRQYNRGPPDRVRRGKDYDARHYLEEEYNESDDFEHENYMEDKDYYYYNDDDKPK